MQNLILSLTKSNELSGNQYGSQNFQKTDILDYNFSFFFNSGKQFYTLFQSGTHKTQMMMFHKLSLHFQERESKTEAEKVYFRCESCSWGN